MVKGGTALGTAPNPFLSALIELTASAADDCKIKGNINDMPG